jgi:hypothetical protein
MATLALFMRDGVRANDTADCKLPRSSTRRPGGGAAAARSGRAGLLSFRPVADLARELGRRLPGVHHHRAELAAAAALPHDFGRQLLDRLGGRCHGRGALGAELGLGERRSWTPRSHRETVIADGRCAPSLFRLPRIALPRSMVAHPSCASAGCFLRMNSHQVNTKLSACRREATESGWGGPALNGSRRRARARGDACRRACSGGGRR